MQIKTASAKTVGAAGGSQHLLVSPECRGCEAELTAVSLQDLDANSRYRSRGRTTQSRTCCMGQANPLTAFLSLVSLSIMYSTWIAVNCSIAGHTEVNTISNISRGVS